MPRRDVGHRGAADHYTELDDWRSQTSPEIVRRRVKAWTLMSAFAEPVLDLGTGVGANLEAIAAVRRSVGVDLSPSALRSAKRHAAVVAADAQILPFLSGSFATVVCTEVLEHVDRLDLVLSEIARVLREDGHAFITSPNYANVAGVHKWFADRRSGRTDWNPWGAHLDGHEAFLTGRKVRSAARHIFEVIEVRGHDYGQAITGRFEAADRLAWGKLGQAVLRRLLPRIEGSSGWLAWHGMHTELILRRRKDTS